MKKITEGTKSYLFGCHQFIMHPLYVTLAWKRLYDRWPRLWELVCIFLHDVGHIGKQYLSDPEQKKDHWKLGAKIAHRLFKHKGMALISGHTKHGSRGKHEPSKLYYADKVSWLLAPNWWLQLSYKIEDFNSEAARPKAWKKLVYENMKKGFPKGLHEVYLDNKTE